MGKIIGKSALCFAGLAIASWLLMQFGDLMRSCWDIHSVMIGMFRDTVLASTLEFLLAVSYTYILFRLFIRDPNRELIIALNGLFLLVLHFQLLFLQAGTLIMMTVQVNSVSVMALALLYKYISGKRKDPKKVYKRAANAILILVKCVACMCFLVVLALAGYGFMELKIPILLPLYFFQDLNFIDLLTAIIYAGALYILLRRYMHSIWIIAANSVFLLIVWSLIILRILPVFILFSYICINTAILIPVLAFIFRSVEKHSAALAASQNTPDEIAPAHPDISG